jgi:hypothetical protein
MSASGPSFGKVTMDGVGAETSVADLLRMLFEGQIFRVEFVNQEEVSGTLQVIEESRLPAPPPAAVTAPLAAPSLVEAEDERQSKSAQIEEARTYFARQPRLQLATGGIGFGELATVYQDQPSRDQCRVFYTQRMLWPDVARIPDSLELIHTGAKGYTGFSDVYRYFFATQGYLTALEQLLTTKKCFLARGRICFLPGAENNTLDNALWCTGVRFPNIFEIEVDGGKLLLESGDIKRLAHERNQVEIDQGRLSREHFLGDGTFFEAECLGFYRSVYQVPSPSLLQQMLGIIETGCLNVREIKAIRFFSRSDGF